MTRSCSVFIVASILQVISGQNQNQNMNQKLYQEQFPGPRGPHSANDPREGPLFHPYQEMIPRRCWSPPPGISPYECCPIPKLYSDEDMETCGIEKAPAGDASPERRPPPDCKRGTCLMKTTGLLKDDESIDLDKAKTFVDNWAKANPNFSEAILIAKDKCIVEGGIPGSPHDCEPDKMFFCLTAHILWNCKLREDIDNCNVLKEHMNECRPYYMNTPIKGKETST